VKLRQIAALVIIGLKQGVVKVRDRRPETKSRSSHKRGPGTKPEDVRVETPDSFFALVDFGTSKALWRTRLTPLVWRRVNRQRRKAIVSPRDENR
jgi:hypothetical protein